MDIIGIIISLIKSNDIFKVIVISFLVSYFYLLFFVLNTLKDYLDKILKVLLEMKENLVLLNSKIEKYISYKVSEYIEEIIKGVRK